MNPAPILRFCARASLFVWLGSGLVHGQPTQVGGVAKVLKVNGGWCWFQDPRAIIAGDHVVIGTTAGTTVSGGSAGGDEDVTDYNLQNGEINEFTLKSAYNQDDHASPAFTVLPDGRILAVYAGHGIDNYVFWRVSSQPGDGSFWGPEQQSTVNITSDGNGNSYSNPFYLSVPNTVYNFSRAIGYDTNYSKITGLNATDNSGLTSAANFSYGGHFQYWKNPNNSGNGRPYVKYTSNGTNRIWLATTEDSPQNYINSIYGGYVEFDAAGNGTVYTATGAALGPISTGTAPVTSQANTGAGIASGTGYSYQPTQFTPILKASANINGYDLSSASPYGAGYPAWGSSMQLDTTGNPYLGIVVIRDLTYSYSKSVEYAYARLVNGVWKTSRVGYGGYPLYNGQNQYGGLIAVDAFDPNKVYFSTNVNPATNADLIGPDGNRHYQIFSATTTDDGATWSYTQLTNTSSDNIRPIIATGSGKQVLLWMQGTYTTYLNYNTNIVGLVPEVVAPVITITSPASDPIVLGNTGTNLHVAADVTETGFTGTFAIQWTTVSGPASAVFTDPTSSDTTVSFPQAGSYVLQIAASDGTVTSRKKISVVVSEAPSSTGLVLRLRLDESSGTAAADSSSSAKNGAITGSTTWLPTGGVLNGALQFNSGGYATLPESSGANSLYDNTSAFSLTYWVKANSFSGTPGVVSKRDGITTNNNFTTYLDANGYLTVDIETNNNRFTSATQFATDTWYHVALVFDGTLAAGQRASLYINGVLDKTATETSTALTDYTSSLKLGVTAAATNPLNGVLDDVRFYRRALTAAEVANIGSRSISPVVSCGTPPSATSAIAANLTGTADGNGNGTLTTAWTKVSGPGTVSFANAASPTTTATFSQAGTYVLRLSATNASGEVRDTITVSVAANPNVLADWTSTNFPGVTNAAINGPAADPDGDSLSNLMEFALGLNPQQPSASIWSSGVAGLPVQSSISVSGSTYLSLQVRRPAGRLGITYGAKVTADLTAWSPAVQEGSAVSNGDNTETVTFRDTVPSTSSDRRFIRLEVTQ